MATLVKIHGLDRGPQVVGGDLAARGFRVNSGLGQQFPAGVVASLTPTANGVTYSAKNGGTYGNGTRITTVVGSLGVATTFTASTGQPLVTVTAPATATLAANQAIVAAVAADPVASQFVTAATSGTGAAANAATGPTNLAGGTDVGTGQPIVRVLNNKTLAIVDVDDPATAKALRRNAGRWVSLGQP